MKNLAFLALLISYCHSFAQTPKSIEQDLYKSYRILDNRFNGQGAHDYDSLMQGNRIFAKKLFFYTSKNPSTITQKFSTFQKDRLSDYESPLNIYTSSDHLFRIYSWDTWTGGSMHIFENVFQYKSGAKIYAILDTFKTGYDYTPSYDKMYTLKTMHKTYYLCTFSCIYSNKDMNEGIKIFAIENGKLNRDVKLIKTKSGLHSDFRFDFDFFSEVDWKVRPKIYFNPKLKTINFPLIDENDKMTHNYIVYRFNGQYFERVKS